jgi:hypothetical protein
MKDETNHGLLISTYAAKCVKEILDSIRADALNPRPWFLIIEEHMGNLIKRYEVQRNIRRRVGGTKKKILLHEVL